MCIRVKDFKWDKGKNDLEYIELLEKNLDSSLSTYRECAKTAREQYKKGYIKGRRDAIDELTQKAFDAEVTDGFGNKETRFFVDVTEIIQLKEQKND